MTWLTFILALYARAVRKSVHVLSYLGCVRMEGLERG